MHFLKEINLQDALWIMQYVKGISIIGILFKQNGCVSLEAYTDIDYARSILDQGSTTRYCSFLGRNLETYLDPMPK